MTFWTQIYIQDPNSPSITQLVQFHDTAIITLTLVTSVIRYTILYLSLNKLVSRYSFEAQEIETIWTILPAVVLVLLAIPSIRLLYIIDESYLNSITIKTIGHQWYWTYQYSDFKDLEFDSYITPTDDLNLGEYRLLEVDNRLVVPLNHSVRILITAADVLHSWTIPSLGVKIDAVPGRLNQVTLITIIPGVFYGQCSEICGVNHRFIPISIEVVKTEDFIKWLNNIE